MGAARLLRGFRDDLRQIDPWVEGENIFGGNNDIEIIRHVV